MYKKIIVVMFATLVLFTGCKRKNNLTNAAETSEENSIISEKLRSDKLKEYLEKYDILDLDTNIFEEEIKPLIRVHTGYNTNYGKLNYSSSFRWASMLNKHNIKYWNDLGYEQQYVLIETPKGKGCPAQRWNMQMFRDKEHTAKYAISGNNIIKLDAYDHFDIISCSCLHAMPVEATPNPQYAICCFNTMEERNNAQIEYAYGDIYSNGIAYPKSKSIVVNSRLLTDITFEVIDGLYWLPLETISNEIGWFTQVVPEGGVEVKMPYSDTSLSFFIPSTESNLSNTPWMSNSECEEDEFYLWDEPLQDIFKRVIKINDSYYIEVETFSRVGGIDIQVSENLIVITSDPYDIAQYFAIPKDSGYGYQADLSFIKPSILDESDYRVKYSKEQYYESYE